MKKTALFLLVFLIGPAWAEAASPSRTLPSVVVTAGRIEEKSTTVTQSVTVITAEEIAKNQHRDLGELLGRYGIQVNSYSPNSSLSRTTMRGLSTELFGSELQGHVLILIDGRRSGTGLVGLLPLVNVERIEILRGPAAVQYGTSAMGGAINIITRRGAEKTHGLAEFGAGSFETLRLQGEAAGYARGFDYALGASFLNMDDYKTGAGKTYDSTDLERKLGYSVNLGYNFLDEHRVGVTALGVDASGMGDPDDIRSPWPDARTDRYNYSFDAIYEGGAKDYGLGWKTRYFTGRGDYVYSPAGYSGSESRTDLQGAQGQLSFAKSFLTLTGGLDWTGYDLWDNTNDDSSYSNIGYFMMAKLAFMDDRVVLSGGLRHDDYRLQMTGKDDSLNHTTPSVGLALNPVSWLTLRGNYGESYIVPSTQQFLGFYDSFYMVDYIGNPGLNPEKGKGWDAGFDLRLRSLNFALTYFQTDYEDKIDARPAGADWQYYNIGGKSRLSGIEAQAGLDVGEFMDWPFALKPYVNLTRMLRYEDADGNDISSISEMDVSYGLGFSHPEWGLDADLRFIYSGKQKITDFDPNGPVTPSVIGGRTTADLYLSQTLFKSETLGAFSLKAEIRNIFDKYYYGVKEYPMPGRSYWLGLRYDY